MKTYFIKAGTDVDIDVIPCDQINSYDFIKESIGGGTFDCIALPSLGIDIWIDDDGKLVENPKINLLGTALWMKEYGPTDIIVGNIVITGGVDDDGNTIGMTEEKGKEMIALAKVFVDALTNQVMDEIILGK